MRRSNRCGDSSLVFRPADESSCSGVCPTGSHSFFNTKIPEKTGRQEWNPKTQYQLDPETQRDGSPSGLGLPGANFQRTTEDKSKRGHAGKPGIPEWEYLRDMKTRRVRRHEWEPEIQGTRGVPNTGVSSENQKGTGGMCKAWPGEQEHVGVSQGKSPEGLIRWGSFFLPWGNCGGVIARPHLR